MHSTEVWQAGIVLIDGTPVLPRLAQVIGLVPLLKKVGNLPDQCAKGIRRHVCEESKEGFN